MKKILTLLLCLYAIGSVHANWEVNHNSNIVTQVSDSGNCTITRMFKYPSWYDEIKLSDEQIIQSVINGVIFIHETSHGARDSYRFKGPFIYFRAKKQQFLVANQEAHPKPSGFSFSKEERFAIGYNIVLWIFFVGMFFLHRMAFNRRKYLACFLFDFFAVATVVSATFIEVVDTALFRGGGIALFLICLFLSIFFSKGIFKDKTDAFFTLVAMIVVVVFGFSDAPPGKPGFTPSSMTFGFYSPFALGLLAAIFFWFKFKIYKPKQKAALVDRSLQSRGEML